MTIVDRMMDNLNYAEKAFADAKNQADSSSESKIPHELHNHMLTAAYAVGYLSGIGEEQLRAFERVEEIPPGSDHFISLVHSSTISGSSLMAANGAITAYNCGVREFTKDQYEQLSRSCASARTLLEHNVPTNNEVYKY